MTVTTSWIVHNRAAGYATQCNGVARALRLQPEVRTVSPRIPFRWLAPYGPPDPRSRPPTEWPDLVIASGRQAIPLARAAKLGSGGRTFVVVLQDPVGSRPLFDLIWTPMHDQLSGPNVISTLTSPHDLDHAELAAAAQALDDQYQSDRRPRVAVLLGGTNRAFRFGALEADMLAARLDILVGSGASVMITPSRRTDPKAVVRLWSALRGRAAIWTGSGPNPYRGMLGAADTLIVTCDSVNMAGEAAFTGKPVYLERLPGGSPKFDRFHQALIDKGVVRWFEGALSHWSYAPVDATQEIAAEIRQRYKQQTGRDL
jgi:uncharacterized protein